MKVFPPINVLLGKTLNSFKPKKLMFRQVPRVEINQFNLDKWEFDAFIVPIFTPHYEPELRCITRRDWVSSTRYIVHY